MRSRIRRQATGNQHPLTIVMSIGVVLVGSLAACSSGEAGSLSGEDAQSDSPLAADSQEYSYDDFGPGAVELVFAGRAFEMVGQDNTGKGLAQGAINAVQCRRSGSELSLSGSYYPNGKVMVQPDIFGALVKFSLAQEPVVEELDFVLSGDGSYHYPGNGAPVGRFDVSYDSDANSIRVEGEAPFTRVPEEHGTDVEEPTVYDFDLLVTHVCLRP